jgi:hypothetical protein
MPDTNTYKAVCEVCFRAGNVVEMEPWETVAPGEKRECPTCSGTWFFMLNEQQKAAS